MVSFIILLCAPLSLLIIPHFSVQHLAMKENEGGDRGESRAAFRAFSSPFGC